MKPTMALVGTVVGGPAEVETPRGRQTRFLLDTRTRARDVHAGAVERWARHEVDLSDELVERGLHVRAGDRVFARARLQLETVLEPRPTLEARGRSLSLEPATCAEDRNEVLVLARLTWVMPRSRREPHEPTYFHLTPISPSELGIEAVPASSLILHGSAFDPLARQLDQLAQGALVALRGALTYEAHWRGSEPEPYPHLHAETWG